MIRDTRKNDIYFEKYIAYQNDRIKKFTNALKNMPDKAGVKRCSRMLSDFIRDLFSAKYSIGASKDELKGIFKQYLSVVNECKIQEYSEYINAVAIAILLDVDLADVRKIAGKEIEMDDLLNKLFNFPSGKDKILKYPDYYQIFLDYLTDKIGNDEFNDYIKEKWYMSSADFAWYDSHKDNNDIYVGYWCWLAAACLKLKRIVNSKKNIYIPYDLID